MDEEKKKEATTPRVVSAVVAMDGIICSARERTLRLSPFFQRYPARMSLLSPAARGTSAVRHTPVSSSSSSESSPVLCRSAMADSGGGAELDARWSGDKPESESDSVPDTAAGAAALGCDTTWKHIFCFYKDYRQ